VGVRVAVVDGLLALTLSLIVVVEDDVVEVPLIIVVVSSPSVTVYKCDGFIFDDDDDVTSCILCIDNIGLNASTALRVVVVISFVSETASRTM
jgi:hypothetical protein